ncbi:MAG: gliding motility-associated C-terminal domain-containing protein, partial [Bacteroidetes bacterium]|nr:gliding motility-associated C-terminal domain-containing protein [Bacteroidota bacterium]
PLLTAVISGSTDIACFGDNTGEATATATGGTPPYTWLWSNTPASTDSQAVGLFADTVYYVTVTDQNGCTAQAQVFLVQPDSLVCTVSVTDAICQGNTGSVYINVTGGTHPYTYQWDSLTGYQTDSVATGLGNGFYSATITDNNECTETITAAVAGSGSLETEASLYSGALCNGDPSGVITLTVISGTPAFTVHWTTGDSIYSADTIIVIDSLSAGNYFLTVTDANGCLDEQSVIVTEPDELIIDSIYFEDITCFGYNDGYAEVIVTGGTGSYNYLWSDEQMQTTSAALHLGAGTYEVTVTDQNLCTVAGSSMAINEPDSLYIEYELIPEYCPGAADGSIVLHVSGGSGNYFFSWNVAGDDSVLIRIQAGHYYATVTDGNNCLRLFSAELTNLEDICLLIPTVITPNNDGVNDTWEITGAGRYEKMRLEIFNRWGNRLFLYEDSGAGYTDPGKQWDGTHKGHKLPVGVYLYTVNLNDGEYTEAGTVTIIR